jgi:nitrogen-specific signal transduction histidine kinase/CheY-like chemotaxis protein
VDAAGIGLWRWEGAERRVVLDARSAALHGFEYSGNSHRDWSSFLERVHPEDHEELLTAWNEASQGDFRNLEYRCVLSNGEIRWLSCSGSFMQDVDTREPTVFGTCFDVSQRKSVDQQLMLAQKVEAVGQLTAGISHNFNNILSAILPNLQMAARHQKPGGEKFLRNATLAAERASDLVAELMVVAGRRQAQSSQALDLGLVVERVVRICKTTFGSWVQLVFEDDSTSNTILGNEGQIEQVLLNILLNARDAFETAAISSPSIRVELESLAADSEGPERLVLCVTDNGPGMEPQVLERIFEPFFTTKGTGTGLGLATAYAIVNDHEGTISCASSPERGTQFKVVLPLSEGPAAVKATPIVPAFVGGTETILVVDDDDLVRRVTAGALEDAGYQVFEARGGNEAIAAQAAKDDFDLVVLDMSMPELTGDQVLRLMRGRDPRIKVLIFTGLTDGRVSRLEDVAILHKPAGINDLLQAVRQAIDSQRLN